MQHFNRITLESILGDENDFSVSLKVIRNGMVQ